MRNIATVFAFAAGLGLMAVAAFADWVPGEPFKMHNPQLPDPNGWDIKVDGNNTVADDFMCTETGPITEVHFWGSWKGDLAGAIPGLLNNIHLSIHANNPMGPSGWSEPAGLPLWEYNSFFFDPSLVTWRVYGTGDQGWSDPIWPPGQGTWLPQDHQVIWQYNVKIDPSQWFIQQQGMIYWLDIHVADDDLQPTEFGWKTSLDHYMDDAVVEDFYNVLPGDDWIELKDPNSGLSLDMAFVIVPEPRLAVLVAGLGVLLFMLVRRNRHKA